MKKIISLLIIVISFAVVHAQMPNTVVEINTDTVFSNFNFSIDSIIDTRADKYHIGYVTRGVGFNNSKVIFKDKSPYFLKQFVESIIPKKANSKYVLIIRNLTVSEEIGTMNQYGYCNLELDFAQKADTTLYSLGTFYANIGENSQRTKYTHNKRILSAFYNCFTQFENSKKQINHKQVLHYADDSIRLDYKNLPPVGSYLNYNQMKRKAPFDTTLFKIARAKETKKYVTYNIELKELLNPNTVNFYCDGKAIYMRTNRTQFIKSECFGKYIYFQGRVPTNSSNTDINNRKNPKQGFNPNKAIIYGGSTIGIAAALLTGTGFIIYGTGNNSEPTTNMTVKGVVINTESEELKFVTDNYLYKITKEHPGMLTEYRKSRRKLSDKKAVILN